MPRLNTLISSQLFAYIGLVFTVLFWAGNIYVSKTFADQIPPFTLNYLRWMIMLCIMSPFVLKSVYQCRHIILRSWKLMALYGFLSVTIYNAFMYLAAHTIDGINIAVISSLIPLLTFITTWMLLGSKPNQRQLIGFILGIIGNKCDL